MHRLFVGLRPPHSIREQLLATMGGVPGARWQSDEQLHITLRFIGEVERPLAEDIAIALGNVRFPPLEVALAGVGQFDSRGRPNALWAGVRPHEALAGLHHKIDQALVRCGLPPEGRAYLPHITLARMNAAAAATSGFLEAQAGLASALFALDHFLLFESHLGREGATYDAVERYPLRA
ncbi:RNA 2',3'-cyclic phosphodiesterase [Sphingomonas sp. M1-B02]|uniref:RNA 2',3'-cyclic phosphodiesterase n=1 Tax=Sphingomonas sp. M1-B02 TaxID=3114300 RepID=UPI00223F1034|nr:RNA 2',3'-cyclic phosphodiesterase [Sphingomonas sp. S6-11]UZK65839.1 RNA 2',3'-cyclic phosphodiesterase [Sphingomonas sp. S6-11]